jgi:hypothetical protein
MKVKTRTEELPQPIKFTLKEENIYDGPKGTSGLLPGEYWLLFVGPVGIEIYTDAQFREKYDVQDVP